MDKAVTQEEVSNKHEQIATRLYRSNIRQNRVILTEDFFDDYCL